MLVSCGLKKFGCKEEVEIIIFKVKTENLVFQIIRNDMGKHYLTQQHQESILKCFSPNIKLSEEESCGFLQDIGPNLHVLIQDLASLKEKVNDMQYISYDGTLVWKIANFKEKMST
jgi:hypothetical protein